MSDIDRILLEMERRGHEYFDETMRIGRVMDLLNRSRVQQGFEHQVVADAPQQIERKVGELVDWLVDADLRQWQNVTEPPGRTPAAIQGADRRRRGRRAVPLRPRPPDRHHRPRNAQGRRFLRSAAGGAGTGRRGARMRWRPRPPSAPAPSGWAPS